MHRDITQWSCSCHACQTNEVNHHHHSTIIHIPVPTYTHIHVDSVGPLPPSDGYTHLSTIIDRYSRWPEVIPLKSTTAQECTNALMLHWVSRFGVQRHLTSDQGLQFTSSFWSFLAATLGVKHHHTSAYHMQSNGAVERFHCGLKASLPARLSSPSWI